MMPIICWAFIARLYKTQPLVGFQDQHHRTLPGDHTALGATFGFERPNLHPSVLLDSTECQLSRVPAHVSSIDAIADAENTSPRSLT
jgi:hypothetical protein